MMELGIKNLLADQDGWTCSVCYEARQGYTDHCGTSVMQHVQELMTWLTKLMGNASSGSIADKDLELVDWDTVFRMLLSPHS